MAQTYDLANKMAPFLDVHLFFPILIHLKDNNLYPIGDLLESELELLGHISMCDYEIETYQQASGSSCVPVHLEEKKKTTERRTEAVRAEAQTLLDLIENTQTISELRDAGNFNMEYLTSNHGVADKSLKSLHKYSKELFHAGQYEMAHYYLLILSSLYPVNSEELLPIMWGKLACDILLRKSDALVDLKYIKKAIDEDEKSSVVSPLMTLERRAWLLHWGVFVCFSQEIPDGREYIVDLCFEEKYRNTIQIYCPWLLRYLAAASVTSKRRRGGDILKKVVRITQEEGYTYRDPITQFVESLYVEFDFQGAQDMLRECDKVFACDFFLGQYRDDFMEKSRNLIFETYCRIHEKINIDMLAEKLGKKQDEAERWVVDLIRNARFNAKINSEEKYVIMHAKNTSIYQQVMEKTKNLSYSTYVLADNLREFYTEAQQRAADERKKRESAAEEARAKEAAALEEKKIADAVEAAANTKVANNMGGAKSVWGKKPGMRS